MHIGVAGLGAMGGNVAARLMEVGHQVTVWNRTPEKTKPLAEAGAKVGDLAGRGRGRERSGHHHADRRRGDRRRLQRAERAARRATSRASCSSR